MQQNSIYTWQELQLRLIAKSHPKGSHPLVVLQAVFKRIFQQALLNQNRHKLLWHCPNTHVDNLDWHEGSEITVTLQLFNTSEPQAQQYKNALINELNDNAKQNFILQFTSPWQAVTYTFNKPAQQSLQSIELDFYTPFPFKKENPASNTLLSGQEFIRNCHKRVKKLFNVIPNLPQEPDIHCQHWSYWRITHASKSQLGHTMYLNGCIGKLILTGPNLEEWLPWLMLLEKVGLGDDLTFSRGRFTLNPQFEVAPEPSEEPEVELLLKRPFIINSIQQGLYLSLISNQLQAKRGDDVILSLPLFRISHIEIQTACSLSTVLIQTCNTQNIPIALSLPKSDPQIILSPTAEFKKNQLIAKHHQSYQQLTAKQKIHIAAAMVSAKIDAQCHLIKQRYQKGDNKLLNALGEIKGELKKHPDLEALKGAEGYASRLYFQWLRAQVAGFSDFETRENKTAAKDPFNMLLNYCYTLLFNRIHVLLRLQGLDPMLGVLHLANGRHPALVSDFIEPWRALVDKMLLRLLGHKVITLNSFELINNRLSMPSALRYRLIQEFTKIFDGKDPESEERLSAIISDAIKSYALHIESNKLHYWQLPQA